MEIIDQAKSLRMAKSFQEAFDTLRRVNPDSLEPMAKGYYYDELALTTWYLNDAELNLHANKMLCTSECEMYVAANYARIFNNMEKWVRSRPTYGSSVAILCFKMPAIGQWTPESVKAGLSGAGSEEAVVYLAEELAKLGVEVHVYADPPEHSRHTLPLANPRYFDCDRMLSRPYTSMVHWRRYSIPPQLKPLASEHVLWPHDFCTRAYNHKDFNRTLWLSEWQRQQHAMFVPALLKDDTDYHVYGNGITLPEDFEPNLKKESPLSCIYTSNYARGLKGLLDSWPMIKASYPEASLDICYGWQTWGCLTPVEIAFMQQQVKNLEKFDVRELGKLSHKEVIELTQLKSVHVYPCTYDETFGISVVKSQACGTIPIVTNRAGLKETVLHGVKVDDIVNFNTELFKLFDRLKSEDMTEQRKIMSDEICEKFSWKRIASDFVEHTPK